MKLKKGYPHWISFFYFFFLSLFIIKTTAATKPIITNAKTKTMIIEPLSQFISTPFFIMYSFKNTKVKIKGYKKYDKSQLFSICKIISSNNTSKKL